MPTQYSMQESFLQAWPAVLIDIEAWVRLKVIQSGEVSKPSLHIKYSRPALRAAKTAGQSIQPAYGEFCKRLARDWEIGIPKPNPAEDLHDAPAHLVTFYYWK